MATEGKSSNVSAFASNSTDGGSTEMRSRTPIVGIAVYNGEPSDLLALLDHAPIDVGFAFVVIQHSLNGRPSISVESLARHTPMPVFSAEENLKIEPNVVYVVPPNRLATLQGGMLHISKPSGPLGGRPLLDNFFRSLASELGERAIGVVLPGMELDGELGLRTIADNGGLTFAQVRHSDEETSVAGAGIRRRIADIDVGPLALGQQLAKYARDLVLEESADAPTPSRVSQQKAIAHILARLNQLTGHDFNEYKETTILRRIDRRMKVHQLGRFDDYAAFLDDNPTEVDALFHELLIGVTSFFRDPEAFACLEEKVIAPLFMNQRDTKRPIRIWIPGCSSGEEAYSVAMALFDYAQRHRRVANFQIFATDINPAAIEKARLGRYHLSSTADIPNERLQKYFTREGTEPFFTVSRQLRDVVVFAIQNIVRDPPFSRLELICCRNLIIYFEPELQQRLLTMMHYALAPGGVLFLGNSETLGNTQRLFRQLDQHSKIYQRNEVGAETRPAVPYQNRWHVAKAPQVVPNVPSEQPPSLREITERLLLTNHTPTAIVVNAKGDMLYVHGRTGRFLEQTTGDVTTNILKIAREGLRLPLTRALHNVSIDRGTVEADTVALRNENEMYFVQLSISWINNPAASRDTFLITLTEKNDGATFRQEDYVVPDNQWNYVSKLEDELDSTREHLQSTIEELETANEDLMRVNEDSQSANEELQSANEELQTSKEELQSVNEELCIVNTELRHKITDLIHANNDIKNLLDNSKVGMIFLDTKLCIRRFTRGAADIVHLIEADIGRPLAHFVHRFRYDRLHDDIREVLTTTQPKELELQALDRSWFLARILPYRTIDDEVNGVVLTFTDVTLLKEANEKLEFLVDTLPVGVSIIDKERNSFKHNAAFLRMCDLSSEEALDQVNLERVYVRPDGTKRETNEFAASRVLAGEDTVLNVESGFQRSNGEMTWLDVSAVACPFTDWSAIVVTSDVTARRNADNAVKASEEKFSRIFHFAPLMIGVIDLGSLTLIDCNQRFLDVSGFTREEAVGISAAKLGWMPYESAMRFLDAMSRDGFICNEEVTCRSKDGRRIDCLYNGFIVEMGGKRQIVSLVQDISERKQAEETIKANLRQEKDTVLRELAHRTKNNMFVIRSMLNLHAMHTQSDEVRRLFTDVENKIFAMALVHQKLYQSNNLSRLDLGQYLQELAPALLASHTLGSDRISFNLEADSISVLIDTVIPCGLVVTELISNSFKYAFPNERTGMITLRLGRKSPDTIHLHVSDNGVGVPEDFDFRHQTTLGLQTIFMIVEHQLKGTIAFHSSSRGLACNIEFADTLHSERV